MGNRRYYKPKHIKKFAERMRRRLAPKELMFLRRLTMANVASFDFQVRIGFYVADFVFPSKMLIIELDGPNHDAERDAKRDAWLSRAGFTTWRIPNSKASGWPLSRIASYERPELGRGYAEALTWANSQHDKAANLQPAQVPRVISQVKSTTDSREDFYKRLIAKTERYQQEERDRREMYVQERLSRPVRVVK